MNVTGKNENIKGNDIYEFNEDKIDVQIPYQRQFHKQVRDSGFYSRSPWPKTGRKCSYSSKTPIKGSIKRQYWADKEEEVFDPSHSTFPGKKARIVDKFGIDKYHKERDNKVYYIANQYHDPNIPYLPKLTLKTLHSYSDMPVSRKTAASFSTTKKLKSFAKIKKKVEKQLQVQLNRKTWHMDKFSLIKSRRNGSDKPAGLYTTSMPRKKKPMEVHKSHLTHTAITNNPSFDSNLEKDPYVRVDLSALGHKNFEKNLKRLYPALFTKSLRIVLFRHRGSLGSPTTCKHCSLFTPVAAHSQYSRKESEVKVTKEHIQKLKMKIRPNFCKINSSESPNAQKKNEIFVKGKSSLNMENSPPPVLEIKSISDKKISKDQKGLPSPLPPVLELEDETEPYVYVERDDEYNEEEYGEDDKGIDLKKENNALPTDAFTVPQELQVEAEEGVGGCTTLEVFVYQEHADVSNERSEMTQSVRDISILPKEECKEKENNKVLSATLPDVFCPLPNHGNADQALPDLNGHAQMERNNCDIPGVVSEEGYDSDATVAYSEGDDEETLPTKVCSIDKTNSVHVLPNDCSTLKIKRTDKLYQFRGSLLQKINSDKTDQRLDHADNSIFKIPSFRPVRKSRGSRSCSKQVTQLLTNKNETNSIDPPESAKESTVTNEHHDKKHVKQEQSLTLTIFRKPKSRQDLKVLQRKPAITNDMSEFGKLISQLDGSVKRKSIPRKPKTKANKQKNGIITSINRVFPNGRKYKSKKDEDELPKILPPKRRRLIKDQEKSSSVQNGMERLIQEFPRHNWLENKYMQEENKEKELRLNNDPAFNDARSMSVDTLSMLDDYTACPSSQSDEILHEADMNDVARAEVVNDTLQCQAVNGENICYVTDEKQNRSSTVCPDGMPEDKYSNDINKVSGNSGNDNSSKSENLEGCPEQSSIFQTELNSKGDSENAQDGAIDCTFTSIANEISQSESSSSAHQKQTETTTVTPAAQMQTEIRNVELDSDVGAVISISENNENAHRTTEISQRENLPPIPRLIHATTLEAFGSLNDGRKSLTNEAGNCHYVQEQCTEEDVHNASQDDTQGDPDVHLVAAKVVQHDLVNREQNQSQQLLKDNLSDKTADTAENNSGTEKMTIVKDARAKGCKDSSLHKHQGVNNVSMVSSISTASVTTLHSHNLMSQDTTVNTRSVNKFSQDTLPTNIIHSIDAVQKVQCGKQIFSYVPQQQPVKSHMTRIPSIQIQGKDVIHTNGNQKSETEIRQKQNEAEKKQLEEALRYEKLLQEYKTIEKMTELKEQERDRLLILKDKMLIELNFMRMKTCKTENISSNAEISLKRTTEQMRFPPPAHQPKKENVIEILEKMERDTSAIPRDIINTCPFRIRNTPLHDAPYDITTDTREKSKMNQSASVAHSAQNKSNLFQMQGHFIPYNTTNVCTGVSRSSSAPSEVSAKSSKTDVFSFQPPCHLQNTSYNTLSLSVDKGKKRSNSEEIVNLKKIADSGRFVQYGGQERKIQEELNNAVAVKRQKMDAVNVTTKQDMSMNALNNIDNIVPQNVSIAPHYRRIAPNNYNMATDLSSKRATVNWHNLNLTKELLRKPHPVPTHPGLQRYATQVPNSLPLQRAYSTYAVPRQQHLRPHTVRLLGATTMPQNRNSCRNQAPTNNMYHANEQKQDVNQCVRSTVLPPSTDSTNYYNGFSTMSPTTYQKQIDVYRETLQHIAPTTTHMAQHSPHQTMKTKHDQFAPPQVSLIHTLDIPVTQPQVTSQNLMGGLEQTNGGSKTSDSSEPFKAQVTRINGNCVMCNKFALYLCSSCQKFWYCSPDCQLKHWISHQNDCSAEKKDG